MLLGRLYVATGNYQARGIRLLAIPTLMSSVLMALMPFYPAIEHDNAATSRDMSDRHELLYSDRMWVESPVSL